MKKRKALCLSLAAGTIYWFLDSFINAFTSHRAFIPELFSPDFHELYMRTLAIVFITLGVYTIIRLKKAELELKKALMASKEEKNKSEAIIAAIGDGISIQDTNFKILYQNQALKNLIGDHVGEYCYAKYEKRDDVCEGCPLAQTFRDGQIHTAERSAPTDKGTLYAEITTSALKDSTGKIIAGIEVVRDITERKKTDKTIHDLSLRQEAILTAVPDIIMEVNNQKIYTWANKAGYEFFGEDVIGKEAAFYFDGEQDTYTLVDALFKGIENVFYVESWQRRRDGEKRLLAWWCRVLKDEGGNVKGALSSARDITERSEMVASLRESESRYKTLLDSVTDYIYTVEIKDGKPVSTTHGIGCASVTGYATEEYVADPYLWYRMIYAEDREQVTEQYEKILLGEIVPPIEHRIIHKDGSIRWVRNAPIARHDKNNALIGYDGLIADITKRKEAEIALKETSQTLQSLIHASPVAITVLDPDGTVLMWNRAAEKMSGWSMAEAVGRSNPMVTEDRQTEFEALRQRVLNGDSFTGVEIKRLRKDGSPIDISLSTAPIRDDKGTVTAIIGMMYDISERKKMEEYIYQIKQDWEETFNSITDMVTVHDKDWNIIRANKAAEKILKLPLLEITKETKCFRYYHGTGKPPTGCPSCDCLKTGKSALFEIFEPHLNMHIELRAIPRFDSNNNIIGLIHIVRDITDKKKLEEQLRHSQKMEAIGQLSGGIAHDFNNILTAIIGYGNILKMKLKEDSTLSAYTDNILYSAERAATLTQSLLAFGRKQAMNTKPVDINAVVRGVEKLLLRVIGEHIEFKTNLSATDLVSVADSGQIEQVLINLATNARDAMPDRGTLTITTEPVEVDMEFLKVHTYGIPGKYALISVTDTGTGMDEKTREKIFEPFFTTKEVGKGTGLGLAMVYGIIKQHKGYINCYSEPGKGTTFKIYLPVVEMEKPREMRLAETIETKGGTETILVAEDEEEVMKLTRMILEGAGYKVIAASDGEDALIKFKRNMAKINLVLLDIIMPKMNGKEVYDRIKKLKPDVKALFASGYPADFVHKQDILDEGLNFISKPVSPRDLLRKVREVLDR